MLKRLFIILPLFIITKLPLYILFFITIMTIIIPLGYWVITGEDYLDLLLDI